ncbi:MAG: Xaa-Pro peptidase family protein [Candidatus Bathyarchaeota archaeon]|nr:Xaa-Pro peptidase family protein [Candidatus Bathyarchaeota archaeon]
MITGFDLGKARELMEEHGLDCVVATSHDNVYYSTGSDIMTISMLRRLAAAFLPLDGEPTFGVHANEEVTARESTWIEDVRVYEGGEWEPLKPMGFVAGVLMEKGLEKARIGLELLDIPGMCLDRLRELLPSAEFVDCQPVFDRLRSVKSEGELRLLSEANMATAKAITVAFEMARPGDTEREIARDMMDLTIGYGADQVAFMTLGAGRNVFETHHIPGEYRIREGDLLHVDFGAYFQGYMSDISRMAVVGEPDETQEKAYEVAVGAERATAEAMRPGAKVMDLHEAVKEYYELKGYEYSRAFIGHGLGIGCHEYPFLGPSHGDWVLESGMFFQVEPSITIGQARVHTEDSFVVTGDGAKNVSLYRDVSELQRIR